jgi:hypothetical protein
MKKGVKRNRRTIFENLHASAYVSDILIIHSFLDMLYYGIDYSV